MSGLEKIIEKNVRTKAEELGYSEEMTETAVNLALALHRNGWKKRGTNNEQNTE